MTSTSAGPAGSSNKNPEHRAQPGTGHFMLTLCRLPGPVSIRPPQSPQLKPFTFFTTHEREPDGNEHLYLHMGYFATLADAEKWVESVRGRFPDAIATIAPGAFARPESRDPAPVEDKSLSDTQVLKILETHGVAQEDVGEKTEKKESECEQIALLRPEDTATRHALKEAVAQGAPVSFAVQLQWSAQPIDLSRVPGLAIFKTHTLYATASHREGHSRYFLRLGFFADPISAKQVAAQVRANFASAAVVPVSDQEVTRAREAGKDGSSIPSLVEQEVNHAPDCSSTPGSSTKSEPVSDPRPRPPGEDRKLELALKRLARREMWTSSDALSESGVRHLKVKIELQRRKSSRAKGVGV
jgi:hypothetical protein